MRFLVDAQLPPELASWLITSGHEAHHVAGLGMSGARDSEIWQKAVEFQAILITKDSDFFSIFQATAGTQKQAGVVWLRVGNTRTRRLLEIMGSLLPEIVNLASQGELFIEVGDPSELR